MFCVAFHRSFVRAATVEDAHDASLTSRLSPLIIHLHTCYVHTHVCFLKPSNARLPIQPAPSSTARAGRLRVKGHAGPAELRLTGRLCSPSLLVSYANPLGALTAHFCQRRTPACTRPRVSSHVIPTHKPRDDADCPLSIQSRSRSLTPQHTHTRTLCAQEVLSTMGFTAIAVSTLLLVGAPGTFFDYKVRAARLAHPFSVACFLFRRVEPSVVVVVVRRAFLLQPCTRPAACTCPPPISSDFLSPLLHCTRLTSSFIQCASRTHGGTYTRTNLVHAWCGLPIPLLSNSAWLCLNSHSTVSLSLLLSRALSSSSLLCLPG
jgi:hypothetical protein